MDSYMKSGELLKNKKEEISPQEMSQNELGKEDAKKQLFSSSNHRIIIIYCIMGDNSTEISARGSSSGTMFACTFCEQLAVVTTL